MNENPTGMRLRNMLNADAWCSSTIRGAPTVLLVPAASSAARADNMMIPKSQRKHQDGLLQHILLPHPTIIPPFSIGSGHQGESLDTCRWMHAEKSGPDQDAMLLLDRTLLFAAPAGNAADADDYATDGGNPPCLFSDILLNIDNRKIDKGKVSLSLDVLYDVSDEMEPAYPIERIRTYEEKNHDYDPRLFSDFLRLQNDFTIREQQEESIFGEDEDELLLSSVLQSTNRCCWFGGGMPYYSTLSNALVLIQHQPPYRETSSSTLV
jgi:hypothetical protein